jgi:NodT family efflux transporter outer membrane factor (OMF) lipoprotein
MVNRLKFFGVICATFFIQSCTSSSQLDQNIQNIKHPDNWGKEKKINLVQDNWLAQLDNAQIQQLVNQALQENHQLRINAYNVDIKKQALIVSGSQLWPELDLSFTSGRNKSNTPTSYNNTNSLNLNLSYEVDIWGKLSDAEREANLSFLAEKANYEQYRQKLVSDVVTSWFSVIEAEHLLALYQNQAKTSQHNLEIIEASYRSGLSNALDVYLSRNQLNNELSRVETQKASRTALVRKLERLVGGYPHGDLSVEAELPLLKSEIPLGLPSQLITRKPSLKASWYQLLAKDAKLAYAHKQRFPSIRLTGSIGNSQSDISDLLSGSSLAWSLLGNISAPLFNAGRLKAGEERARFELKQGEQQYLDSLYSAFNEVENAITLESTLKSSYHTMLAAQQNAEIAQALSFEQYQSGLVTYTTVLDAQSRSFEAQSTLIKLKNELIANRVNLHFSLGGDFSSPQPDAEVK